MSREADADRSTHGGSSADARRLRKARYCSPCASWREESPCPVCGADLLLEGEEAEERDAAARAVGPSSREFIVALAREVLPALPGAIICALLAGAVLSSQLLPLAISNMHWPGRIVAGFIG